MVIPSNDVYCSNVEDKRFDHVFFVLRNDVLENLLELQSPVYWFFIQVSFSLQCKLVHIHTKYLEIFLALV